MMPKPDNMAHEPVPALRPYPSRLFIETTSRCNLNCFMCMKQNAGSSRADGDLAPETFASLEPAMTRLDAMVLNGVGEPLLNTRLEQYISRARERMPRHGWVGFQSNGQLLTSLRAISLANAGLDRICLSLDGVTPDTFRTVRTGGELSGLDLALGNMAKAKTLCGRQDLQVGVEFVVMRDNLRELPAALNWAAQRQVSFAIVTHMLPYDESHADRCAYDLCTDEALALFHVWQDKAEVAGIEISRYFDLLWKYDRTPQEQRIIAFISAMKSDAQRRGVTLDLKRLLNFDYGRSVELYEVFAEAEEVAARTGIELRLPQTTPREQRSCDFVQQGGAFVSWDGLVHPCYYLWHHCRAHAVGWLHPVQPRVFGNLAEESMLELWNGQEFRAYRENILKDNHPFCPGCPSAPCDYIQAEPFAQDCYLNSEPCGACLWGNGLFQCLS
ncbi:MAG TPA: radical SAM/SPASM family putative metalloenzyme maturase [Geobacteraceae bacterium]|nr:radical SAM/SPASM family putative metalloenzyme maturase [Geobacteraceae bacterium]